MTTLIIRLINEIKIYVLLKIEMLLAIQTNAVKSSSINYNFLVRNRIGFFENFICYIILYFLSNDPSFVSGTSL